MPRFPVLHVYGLPAEVLREPAAEAFPDKAVRGLPDEAAFAAAIPEMEVILVLRPPRGHWAGARRLQLIQTTGAGVDAVLPAPDLPPHVRVANARGVHAAQMSEHALAMMLHFAKRIPRALAQQRERTWRMYGPSRLERATCGVLGLGAIGLAVAERARQLGMRVLATQRHPEPSPHADPVLGPDATARVLTESDYVVVILPLTPETRGSLDAKMLSNLKREAVLVNMARGGIVDETALAAMLREDRLRGAALDVFEEEPLPPESPLWDVPNLLVTPHVAGFSHDYIQRVTAIFLDNVTRLERGDPLRNEVDRERGY